MTDGVGLGQTIDLPSHLSGRAAAQAASASHTHTRVYFHSKYGRRDCTLCAEHDGRLPLRQGVFLFSFDQTAKWQPLVQHPVSCASIGPALSVCPPRSPCSPSKKKNGEQKEEARASGE